MATALDPDTVRAALELAVRAPSIHNSQPWWFRVRARCIELYADPSRQLGVTDPDGRDLLVSCGAALHHLRVALSALGWLPVTDRLPDPGRPEHLATIEAVPQVPQHADLALAVSIPRRRSDRRAYGSDPLPAGCLDELTRRAAAERTALRAVHAGAARANLVSVIAEADVLHQNNPAYAFELARRTGTDDGVPIRQFSTVRLHQPVKSEVDNGGGVDGAGTLLVLGTTEDDRMARLRAGEATSAVLLTATRMGLATCPLTQPLEIPATREHLRAAALDAELIPQMVLRIGWPATAPNPFPPTRRRPTDLVTEYAL